MRNRMINVKKPDKVKRKKENDTSSYDKNTPINQDLGYACLHYQFETHM